ncbi:MAG: FMN-binding protein [Spirochaetaceae bacterium]|nr:MAG: FMN-binding protein [Spirochaetaceae bacterium]
MKKTTLVLIGFTMILLLGACEAERAAAPAPAAPAAEEPAPAPEPAPGIADGRYRGIFGDGGEMQVSIQFDVENETFRNVSFRHLQYRGTSFRNLNEDNQFYPIFVQHQQIGEYLEGKPLSALADLYNPGDVIEDIDTFSGATIRANKVVSAIQDGLNRGIYSARNGIPRDIGSYQDGTYRGTYEDSGEQQVSVQFRLADNRISNVSYRHLQYRGTSFRNLSEGHQFYPIFAQHQQIAEYLEGKPLETIFDLHSPGEFVDDIDGVSGATIRANKVFSAIRDGLNRGIYAPANGFSRDITSHPDGRYRGTYGDGGEQQVSIQFNVTDNRIGNISFRHLQYRDNNFRNLNEDHQFYPIFAQHLQIAEYLDGKPLEAIYDLHSPGDFIDDIDGVSGATLRANKVFSAIMNGLSRGIY